MTNAWILAWLLITPGLLSQAADGSPWVERLANLMVPELGSLRLEIEGIDRDLAGLSVITGVNSGNRLGFQSAGKVEGEDLWLEVEFAEAISVDRVVLIPLLGKGVDGPVAGFGFPKRFVLEGFDEEDQSHHLMDETGGDFPNPGFFPVSAPCPAGVVLRRIRLTATESWDSEGPPMLGLAELIVLRGNRNMTLQAKVRSSSSREIRPAWSRHNLVDQMTPLGLPLAQDKQPVMGWHGEIARSMNGTQAVTVDLGEPVKLDEIRLIPAWRSSIPWDSYYGFPARFLLETALTADFKNPETVHDRTTVSLQSPGRNMQSYGGLVKPARYIRLTATRLRERTGDFVFALGEIQAYAGDVNLALNKPVIAERSLEDTEWSRAGLTDGVAGGGSLLELPEWFRQLEQRKTLEQRREALLIRRRAVLTEAEHLLVGTSIGSAGGIALIAGLFSWRGHRQRVRDRERHRERLARDLHDELGSNLGSIALISSFADQEDAAQMRLDLAEIEMVARESADSMRDMVSLLGGGRGGAAADWLNVMNGLAQRLMRGVELECRLPTAPLTWEPNLETRRELYLFCKEVLHNAARHARPSQVEFFLSPTPGGLRIEITDDGCGFDPDAVESGHGLGNIRERAAMMRAEMTLESSPGTGTKVVLDVPRGRRWKKC
jgi:signal transduction histidine kinase